MKAYPLYRRQATHSFKWVIHGLGEFLYRFVIVPLVAFLPARIAYGVACVRGDWSYRHDTSTCELIMQNSKVFSAIN